MWGRKTATESGRIILRLSGIDFDRNPGTPYQVYLNLPEGEEADPHSIYFAGVLGFFGLSAAQHDAGHGQAGQDAGGVRLFDITDLVRGRAPPGSGRGTSRPDPRRQRRTGGGRQAEDQPAGERPHRQGRDPAA